MLVGGMWHPTTMLGTTMGPLTTEAAPLHVGANGAPRSKFAYPKLYNSHCALGLGVGLECELWNMGATCKDAAGGGIRCNFVYFTHLQILTSVCDMNAGAQKVDSSDRSHTFPK